MTRRDDPAGAAGSAARTFRGAFHFPLESYGPYSRHVNRPAELESEPEPLTEADVALWPDWTIVAVEALPLEAFDDDGRLIEEGGEA